MRRLLRSLLVVLLVTAPLAGCFGDDGDDGDQPNPTATPPNDDNVTGDNNTTDPFAGAKFPPIPVMDITLEADGEALTGSPYLVELNSFVNVTFDASNSSDPDGEVRAYSWEVSSAAGFSGTSTNATFVADFGKMERQRFGVYKVTLKVLDDDSILNTTVTHFVINYHNTLALPGGMNGPGNADREDEGPNEQQVQETLGIPRGTYKEHLFTLAQNASAINLSLVYTGAPEGTQMALYLFDPTVEDTQTAEPRASAGPDDSPVDLDYSDNLTSGTWKLRVELDGLRVEGYTVDVTVTYAVPE